MSGTAFIRLMAELRGLKDMRKADRLIARFELDPSGRLKRMSKGMKQKIAWSAPSCTIRPFWCSTSRPAAWIR